MTTDNFEYPSGILIPGTKYKVIRRLGAGGMGTVYEVEDTNIEKRYVLKTLHASLSSRADLAERMRREARALARLEHRNIVQVITADVTADSLRLTYLVMEKLNGHMLRTVLDNKTRLNVDTGCRLTIDLLNALYHAHENRIIHRDVKPENIFLHRDADGTTVTKLLDFGIMTEADPETNAQTGHNRFIGTLRYAAPEQLSGRPVTAQTDIYAAGLCLYEIITGYGPFDDLTSTAEIAHAHLQTTAPPLSKHVRVPRQLEDIVRRALAKDPADRQHDAFTFAAELNRFRKSQQGSIDIAPMSQVETVNDPFYLSTDPGAQQRAAAISGAAFSRPTGGPSASAAPVIIAGASQGAQALQAQALQQVPQPQAYRTSETGGSGVRPSGNLGTGDQGIGAGFVHPSAVSGSGSSDPGRPRSHAFADAATEFDDGDPAAPNAFSSSTQQRLPSMVRSAETHENAAPAPMTANGPTPVPAAAMRQHVGQPPVDRNAPTGTYAPPGAPPGMQRSGTAFMGAVDSHASDPSDPQQPMTAMMQAPPQMMGYPPQHAHPDQGYNTGGAPVFSGNAPSTMSYAGAPMPQQPAKRGLGPVLWIIVAGGAIGAALAIGGIYHFSHSAKPTTTTEASATVAAPTPAPLAATSAAVASATVAAEPTPPAARVEEHAATVVDAGVSPTAFPGQGGAQQGAAQGGAAVDTGPAHHHHENARPPPAGSGKKLPGSGL